MCIMVDNSRFPCCVLPRPTRYITTDLRHKSWRIEAGELLRSVDSSDLPTVLAVVVHEPAVVVVIVITIVGILVVVSSLLLLLLHVLADAEEGGGVNL